MNAGRCRHGRRFAGFGRRSRAAVVAATICSLVVSGCASPSLRDQVPEIAATDVPRELQKVSMPPYRVEPPDILSIEALNNIRRPDDPLRAGDELVIRASGLLPATTGDPVIDELRTVNGPYRIQTDGTVDLGPEYGTVPVEGLTVAQSRDAIQQHLIRWQTQGLKNVAPPPADAAAEPDDAALEGEEPPPEVPVEPEEPPEPPVVSVTLADVNGKQPISGEHLVHPDGTVSLGIYGRVYVAGMTLDEVKQAVEIHLQRYIHQPEVAVDVLSYNSKVVYVVTDGGGFGEQVVRLPYTGNETVFDAISNIEGLSEVSSKDIWVARPAPAGVDMEQTMPVDWRAITQGGVTTTNYQLLPGDRVYIKADCMITMDNFIARTIAPFQRIMGFILLGNGTVRALQQGSGGNQGGFGAGGFGGF